MPALAIARERRPGAFKRAVKARFCAGPTTAAHLCTNGFVFYGSETGERLKADKEDFDRACQNIESFLRMFARTFLDADSYNAAKHGLALRAGRSRLTVDVGDQRIGTTEARQLSFLSTRRNDDDDQHWVLVTRWLDIDLVAQQVLMAQRMIDSLWRCARARYLGESAMEFPRLDQPRYEDLPRTDEITFFEMTRGLVYEADDSTLP